MSMKLSPAMSPAGLNFREYNSCFSQLTNIRPQQSRLTLTPSTPREEITEEKPRRKPPSSPAAKNGGGRGETPYHVGRMQHTQDSNTSAWNGCLCPHAGRGHGVRMGGNGGPSHGPHPEGHP